MDKKIMSMEKSYDLEPSSIVQYSIGDDFVAFCLSDMDLEEIKSNPESFFAQVEENKLPLWSELSKNMQYLITLSTFDMSFLEFDDCYWIDVDDIWSEACEKGLDNVVRIFEDDCRITVYCGAMCCVNWAGHPVYGKPCLA